MAILKIKRLIEDLERNQSQVIGTVTKSMAGIDSGTAAVALVANTATYATSAGYAGTARVAHFGSSGTGGLAGT